MPTKFRVHIAGEAQEDVQIIHDLIARDKKKAAGKWVREFHRRAKSLRYFPERYELVPEAEDMGRTWRHIIWGNYRIIYRIDAKDVTILRVIHARRLLDRSFFTRLPKVSDS